MRNNLQQTFRSFAVVCGAALTFGGASALSNVASAQTPAPATPAPAAPAAPASTATPWTYQGLFDLYYLYDGNYPKGVGSSQITGFEYDQNGSTPTLSLAELNIAKAPPAAGGLGFKTTLIAGETADENGPGTTDESRYKNIQQLYVTYAAASGAGVDFGKFYTPFGYEVTESNGNYNYSRSFIFTDLLPVYHVGFRAYTPSYKGLVATAWLVKSLNNYDAATGDFVGYHAYSSTPATIGQLNYTSPSGKWVGVETLGYSNDEAKPFKQTTLLSDTDLTLTPTAVDTFGLNETYRADDIKPYSGHENGVAAYYRRQISNPYAVAFRAEYIEGYGGGAKPHADSLTATFEDKTTKSLLLRLEYRHDDTDTDGETDPATVVVPQFVGGVTPVNSQNTVSLSAVYTFGP